MKMHDFAPLSPEVPLAARLQVLGYSVNSGPSQDRRHDHSGWQVELPRKGRATMQVGDEAIALSEGEILLIPPGLWHAFAYDAEEFQTWSLKFELKGLAGAGFPRRLDAGPVTRQIRGLLETVITHHFPQGISALLSTPQLKAENFPEVVLLEYALAGLVAYAYVEADTEPFAPAAKIRGVLKQQRGAPLTVADAARILGFSRSHVSLLFKQHYGMPLKTFIDRERAEIAKRLLDYTDMNVSETARAMEFQDVYYFSSFFKRVTGQCPLSYLKARRLYGSPG
jgi:AraC family transcriptional activator of pobA